VVEAMVRDGGGQAWWVGDEQIAPAGDALREQGHEVALECWAGLAGLRVAASEAGVTSACLLLTGRAVSAAVADEESGPGSLAQPAVTWEDVLALVEDLR